MADNKGPFLIEWAEVPKAISRYLGIRAPHLMDQTIRVSTCPEGLLIERVEEKKVGKR